MIRYAGFDPTENLHRSFCGDKKYHRPFTRESVNVLVPYSKDQHIDVLHTYSSDALRRMLESQDIFPGTKTLVWGVLQDRYVAGD